MKKSAAKQSAKPKLRLGLPKGSLQDATIEKMAKAGFNVQVSSRSYVPYVDDDELEIRLIRAQEISRYVEHGYLDAGITGQDWIVENGSKVHEVGEFIFSKISRQPTRWVLAVPENSPIQSAKDLEGRRIATEVVNITKRWLRQHKVRAEVEFSWGATEVKAHELVDAIVEVTETGFVHREGDATHVRDVQVLDRGGAPVPGRDGGSLHSGGLVQRRWQPDDELPDGAVRLIETVEDVDQLEVRDPEKLAFVTQTTLSVDDTKDVIAALQRLQSVHEEAVLPERVAAFGIRSGKGGFLALLSTHPPLEERIAVLQASGVQ